MKTFLSTWLEKLRSSYWFLPSLLAVGAIAFSALTLHIDGTISPECARNTAWIWAGAAEGARNVLATIAGSTITVAGVVFSITIVTLTLASSQFGPRLLRNFMNDPDTQLVLGAFVATFLCCLLVLRAIRGLNQVTVVPFLSVTCGLVLAVVGVGFLIFFIHHISTSIIAENVIGRVADDLSSNIDRLFPDPLDPDSPHVESEPTELPNEFEEDAFTSIHQLVEVAVRALSPGVNDPFTAISCAEWLGAALMRVAQRQIPSRWRYDEAGHLSVITEATDFAGVANAALNQLRQYGCGSVAVTVRLLDILSRTGPRVVRPNDRDREVLLAHVHTIQDDGLAATKSERDQEDIRKLFAAAEVMEK